MGRGRLKTKARELEGVERVGKETRSKLTHLLIQSGTLPGVQIPAVPQTNRFGNIDPGGISYV